MLLVEEVVVDDVVELAAETRSRTRLRSWTSPKPADAASGDYFWDHISRTGIHAHHRKKVLQLLHTGVKPFNMKTSQLFSNYAVITVVQQSYALL